jgi:lysozyme
MPTPTSLTLDALKRDLVVDEARKYVLYDDATGRRITKGTTVQGHPTWGIGFNCDAIEFTDAAIDAQFESVLSRRVNEVLNALPWVQTLPPGPFRAIVNIAYNAGLDGLLTFHRMLGYAQAGNYVNAASEILDSALAPARAQRLAALMRAA